MSEASTAATIGSVLRRIRRERDRTLKQVELRSGGRFKATSLAGYERGERDISLRRFLELCDVYEVDAGRLVSGIQRDLLSTTPIRVDPDRVAYLTGDLAEVLARHVDRVRSARGPSSEGGALALRHSDLEILATLAGVAPEDLVTFISASY
jgi:transcriptional regulator with XRE-family HTH domain